jgi:hypothetical protein
VNGGSAGIPAIETLSLAGAEPTEHGGRDCEAVWRANRAVAQAYGLGPDDVEHILSTFPVFARQRPAFYAYLQERVREWKKEGFEATAQSRGGTPDLDGSALPMAAEGSVPYRKAHRARDKG